MWSWLAKICIVTGTSPDQLGPQEYHEARTAVHDAVIASRGYRPKTLSTPLFGLDAVMFHRGQAPAPDIRRRWTGRPVHEVDWDQLAQGAPVMVATMRRYLRQCAISLRPSSVALFDTTLRQFSASLITADPPVTRVADIGRGHVEAYKQQLADRPGYRGKPLSKTTLGMRMGHLHTFFTRILEWDYDDVPARVPVYRSDRPRLDEPLPRFLDDAQAAAFMTATRNLPDPLDRLMVTTLARTGMRRGELLGLTVDAIVQIGTGYWLRTPVGETAHRPVHPAPPPAEGPARRMDRRPSRLAGHRPAADRTRPPDPSHPGRQSRTQGRHRRRDRARPPAPAAPHTGHPGDQPRHEPGGHRRAARPPRPVDDHGVRPDRRPHRRHADPQVLTIPPSPRRIECTARVVPI